MAFWAYEAYLGIVSIAGIMSSTFFRDLRCRCMLTNRNDNRRNLASIGMDASFASGVSWDIADMRSSGGQRGGPGTRTRGQTIIMKFLIGYIP